MSSPQTLSSLQKFFIVVGALIIIQGIFLAFFHSASAPQQVKDAIAKAVDARPDLPADRRAQLTIQLALSDFKSKNNRFPTGLSELVPEYFDSVPIDPASGRQFAYSLADGRYSLGTLASSNQSQATDAGTKLNATQLAALEQDAQPAAFVYDPLGKRDPFAPFDFSQTSGSIDPRNPLTAYDYGQLRLTSVLAGFDEPLAVVENSVGHGFTIRKGTKIGKSGGEVIDIQGDKVIILEEGTDFAGQKKSERIEMKLRAADPGDGRNVQRVQR